MNSHALYYYRKELWTLHHSLKYFSIKPEYGGSNSPNAVEIRKDLFKRIKEIEEKMNLK